MSTGLKWLCVAVAIPVVVVLGQFQVRFGLAQLRLQFVVVDLQQHLTLGHRASFFESDLRDTPAEFAHEVHLFVGHQGAGGHDRVVQDRGLQHVYLNGHGRSCTACVGCFLSTTAGAKGQGQQERSNEERRGPMEWASDHFGSFFV